MTILDEIQTSIRQHTEAADRSVMGIGRRTAEGSVAGQDIDGDLVVIEVDTGGAPALTWAEIEGN
ncbi:MAG TPA: hypothetical protein VGS19_25380 [Streptosporangiaceae bacterium]|nr:hypothetical protein [Streptosporangiaceae bacterium]